MLVKLDTRAKSVFKNPLLYSSGVLLVGALSVGWILFSRWQQAREFENRAKEQKTQVFRSMQMLVGLMCWFAANVTRSPC